MDTFSHFANLSQRPSYVAQRGPAPRLIGLSEQQTYPPAACPKNAHTGRITQPILPVIPAS
jgi:hypothetical protein